MTPLDQSADDEDGMNEHGMDEDGMDDDVDPDKLSVCAYWRCGELFERRTANQRYCRKACRSRQNKWLRAVERRRGKSARTPKT